MLLINHFKTIYRNIFLRINMLELIISLFLMKNDGLGIFSLKTISISQNYPLKMHNIYETILLTIFHGIIMQCYVLSIFYHPLNVRPTSIDGYNF